VYKVETKLAIQKWKEEDGGGNRDTIGWLSTPEAHHLIEKLKATWESTEHKEYKWRVIDDEAEVLDEKFIDGVDMTIRDLGSK
jgi:hypothetical protein